MFSSEYEMHFYVKKLHTGFSKLPALVLAFSRMALGVDGWKLRISESDSFMLVITVSGSESTEYLQ
jgi:hypothetical protein